MLYKFRCAAARFMYGRNGADQLARVTVWAALIASILATFLQKASPLAASILSWLSLAVWGWTLFRMLSKNLTKRRAENQRWIGWWRKAKNSIAGAKARRADKDHKYFTCKCGAICRVPVGKGTVVITCPKCGAHINAKT